MKEIDHNVSKAEPIISSLIKAEPELRPLIEAFIDRLPGMIAQIEGLLGVGDMEGLKLKLHDLQGVGGGYGFSDISQLADEMMKALRGEQLNRMPLLITKFREIQSRIILDYKVNK